MSYEKKRNVLELAWQIEDVLQSASAGDYSRRCPVSITESFAENPLTTVIPSINLLLDDLQAKERRRVKAEQAQRSTIAELEKKIETIKRQAEAINELSTPAIEVWEKILVMPIIGVVDTARGRRIVEEMLSAIKDRQARFVIIDITGVDVVDTSVAHHLIQAVRSGRLLGAICLLTGVSPYVARSLVGLGVHVEDVVTLGSLKDGLRYCLSRSDR